MDKLCQVKIRLQKENSTDKVVVVVQNMYTYSLLAKMHEDQIYPAL